MPHLPLGALRVFEAVARQGSFSSAAVELCVTQSAVSHQIRGLEAWLGAPLFERMGNRVAMLPHATDLASALGYAFRDVEGACQRARRAGGPSVLTVAAIPSVAVCWLIPRLGTFAAAAPGVEVRIVYALHGRPIDFSDVAVAVIFSEAPPILPGKVVTPFLPGSTVPVAAPHLGRPRTPAAMAAAGLLHDTDATGWRDWFAAAGDRDPAVPAGPIFEDFNLLRAAALAGQGVALCPLAIIADDLAEGRLVQLSGTAIREGCGYYIVSDAAAPPAVESFRQWLLSTADSAARGHAPEASKSRR